MTLHHFGAGPAYLPEAVKTQIQEALFDWQGSGVSILEAPHRSDLFQTLITHLNTQLRDLLTIPDDFSIVWPPGGARLQAAILAAHFLKRKALYCNTGHWAQTAIEAASLYGDIETVPLTPKTPFPTAEDLDLSPFDYVHTTANETLSGLSIPPPMLPDTIPLFSDMTSSLLTTQCDFDTHSLVYAATQKNLGIAGLSVVILKNDLLIEKTAHPVPHTLHYKRLAKAHSCEATPPTFALYVASLMLDWITDNGGIPALEAQRLAWAKRFYDLIDEHPLYKNTLPKAYRSSVNLTFTLPTTTLTDAFLAGAQERGLLFLKGHRAQGGIRLSLYNAQTSDACEALFAWMTAFKET